LLARRELNRLQDTSSQAADERETFINEKLAQVDALQTDGNISEARKILTGILSLYGDNADYASLIAKVKQRLKDLPSAADESRED
jgi:hypothetical protein